MNIAVAGTGYVGLVAGVCFAHFGNNVTCVDVDEAKVNMMRAGIAPIYEAGLAELMQECAKTNTIHYTTDYKKAYAKADVIIIGVGTPEMPDGSANLDYIATVSRQIAENVEKDCLVVVKSTVPVGTNDKVEQFIKDFIVHKDIHIEVASNPEFLAQGCAVRDTLEAKRIVIGVETKWAEDILKKIYEPFKRPIIIMNRRSAEMTKYACNDFLALKISYMNEIANLCELLGADITEVAEGMKYDDRIGSNFLSAGVGYGGSCFPKDTKALKYQANKVGYELKTIEATAIINKEQKTKLFKKASERMITFAGLKVAVLGLAFKPGTDDIREAPSIENVRLLLEAGANVYAYDSVDGAVERFKQLFKGNEKLEKDGKGSITYVSSPINAIKEANLCFVFTEDKIFKAIAPLEFMNSMKLPIVLDGRNIYDAKEMKKAGVEYYSIGR